MLNKLKNDMPIKLFFRNSIFFINLLIVVAISYMLSHTLHNHTFIFKKLYYKKVLIFTVVQALLSAIASVILSLCLLPCFFNNSWKKREKYLYPIFNLPYFTPSIIGAFAIISFFGQNGLLSKICNAASIQFNTFIYGLSGIVITHLFFYLPLALKLFKRSLDFFSQDNALLARAIGIKKPYFWFKIVLPYLKNDILRVFSLIALYCLRSFTTVLIFGGGSPKTNTLEIALFQALHFETNYSTFSQIVIAQLLINSGFFIIPLLYKKSVSTQHMNSAKNELDFYSIPFKWIMLLICFLLITLGSVFIEGLFPLAKFYSLFRDAEVIWCAIRNIGLGLLVSILTLMITAFLVVGSNNTKSKRFFLINFEFFGFCTLIFSPLVIGASLYFLLRQFTLSKFVTFICILLMQIISFLPSVYRILSTIYLKQASKYDQLCTILGIKGYKRFLLIDWPLIKPALGFCIAITLIFSLGDARSFLFFNIGHDSTLITLLFEKMKAYHFAEAASLATFILLLCYFLFVLIAKIFGEYKSND